MGDKVRITQGPPAKGNDFFDRERLINDIWGKLDRSSIILEAPRRFGKTSVMMELKNNPENNYSVFYFDIEHLETPEEFVLEIMEELQKNNKIWSKIKSGISSIFDSLEENIDEFSIASFKISLRESDEVNWKVIGEELLKSIVQKEKNILVILDEFPEMVKHMINKNPEEAEIFLSWFRKVRQTIPDSMKLRFLIGGSVCLNNILNQIHCIDKINDIESIKMEPFTYDKSREFIESLFEGEGVEINEVTKDAIQNNIGTPIPFFIQVLIGAILKESENPDEDINPEFVKDVYEDKLLGADYKTYFEHYHMRLDEYYSGIEGQINYANAARKILTEISKNEPVQKNHIYQLYLEKTNQESDKTGFSNVMALLEHEFYLVQDPKNNTYEFFSKVLKDWWYKHFGSLE